MVETKHAPLALFTTHLTHKPLAHDADTRRFYSLMYLAEKRRVRQQIAAVRTEVAIGGDFALAVGATHS
jgi:hypothetical protein